MLAAVTLSVATVGATPGAAELVRLEPVAEEQVAALLEAHFTLPVMLDILARSRSDPQEVIAAEVSKLTELLTSLGYLEARVEMSGAATQDDPLRLWPVTGPLYRIGTVRVEGLPPYAGDRMLTAIAALVSKGAGATALHARFEAVEAGLLFELRQGSYADAVVTGMAVALDRQAGRADLVVTVEPGSRKWFGDVAFRGSLRMADADAAALVPFRRGDAYSVGAVDALREALEQTGRFRRIRIETRPASAASDVIDVTVRLWDKAQEPVGAGAVQPRALLAAIGMVILVQALRMTASWSDRVLRRWFLGAATVMVGGAAVEVGLRLYGFVHP